jgi:hypothetical protein
MSITFSLDQNNYRDGHNYMNHKYTHEVNKTQHHMPNIQIFIKIGMLNALDEYIIHLPILYLLTSLNLKSYSKVHVNFSQLFIMNIA